MMKKITLVALGDSLTYGYGVLEPYIFTERLKADYKHKGIRVFNKGVNGNTTREAVLRLEHDVLVHSPNVVIIWLGANDCALNENYYRPILEYEKHLRFITEKILALQTNSFAHDGKPFVYFITPPPVIDEDYLPFSTTDRVQLYAESTKKIAKEYGCPVIDYFEALWAKNDANFADYFQYDGIHLSNKGYDLLYSLLQKEMDALFLSIQKESSR